MPPRWMTWAIVAFWLATTTWLVVREVAPRWRGGEPPPYTIDLTDEVSAQDIHWNIPQGKRQNEKASARSWVHRLGDRTFELGSEIKCTNINVFKAIELKTRYQVTEQGELLGIQVHAKAQLPFEAEIEGDIAGRVEDGFLTPVLSIAGREILRGEKTRVPGSILNSMHLLNKISGLREGQSWSVPLIDPLQFLLKRRGMSRLDAEVAAEVLRWHGADVACHVIEYREPGDDKVMARTWVRQSDGIVLQHFARHEVMELTLQRDRHK